MTDFGLRRRGVDLGDSYQNARVGRMVTAALGLTACLPAKPDVSFSLGTPSVAVDSTEYGYSTRVTAQIAASGSDSLEMYLVALRVRHGVSFEVGEKPDSGVGSVFVENGRGEVVQSAYVTRCRQFITTGCLDRWVDPDISFEIVGWVPVIRP